MKKMRGRWEFGVVLGVIALAFVGGWLARQVVRHPAVAENEDSARSSEARRGIERPTARRSARVTLRSPHSLEDVMALEGGQLKDALALWLLDATEKDIAAYWHHHLASDSPDESITDLVMIGWTRVDPQAAIAATSGTENAHYAWWAWACHEPGLALDTALASEPDRVGNVAWGIGEFHPAWMCEHADRIPEGARGQAIGGLIKWGELEDPRPVLDLLKDWGRIPPAEMVRYFISQDPWAAHEWFEENHREDPFRASGTGISRDEFFETLATTRPEALERMLERQPSGMTRVKMEEAHFKGLLAADPERALEEARRNPAPTIAAERMAMGVTEILRRDPRRAIELASELFHEYPDAFQNPTRIAYPNGSRTSYGRSASVQAMAERLVAREPERLMEILSARPESGNFSGVAEVWARRDVEGLAEWAVGTNDPKVVNRVAPTVSTVLEGQHRYPEALSWAIGQDGQYSAQTGRVLSNWHSSDPVAAREWLEAADLPEAQASHLKQILTPPTINP